MRGGTRRGTAHGGGARAAAAVASLAAALAVTLLLAAAGGPAGADVRPVPISSDVLGPGSEDPVAVAALQVLLRRLGWIVPLDGAWGPATQEAVEQFQAANGLDVTGVLDDSTRAALGSPEALGLAVWEFLDPPPTLAADPLTRIIAIADRTGFDWRAAGGTYVYGCPPSELSSCTLGAYVPATRTMYVSSGAFTTRVLLEYIVLHELAHLWQFTLCPPPLRTGSLAPFGLSGTDALQAGADCLATHWGARFRGYYRCPPEAVAVVGEVYDSTIAR